MPTPTVYCQLAVLPADLSRYGTLRPITIRPDLVQAAHELSMSRPTDILALGDCIPHNLIYVAFWLAMHGSVRLLVHHIGGSWQVHHLDNVDLRRMIEEEASRLEAAGVRP